MDWIQFGILLTAIIGVGLSMAVNKEKKTEAVEAHERRHTKIEGEVKEVKNMLPRLEKLLEEKFKELKEEIKELKNEGKN